MKYKVLDECCIALETAEVFVRYVNHEDYQETKNKMLTRYGARFSEEEKEQFVSRIGLVAQANAMVMCAISDTPEINFLFRKHYYDNTQSIMASVILLNFGDMLTCTVEDYLDSCIKKWKHRMNEKVHLRAVAYSALVFEAGDTPLCECLLDDIDALNYPHEFKWDLYKVLHDFEKYIGQLKEILLSINSEMQKAMQMLEPVVEEMKDFWKKNMTEELVIELADSMGLSRADVTGKQPVLQILRMPCDQAIIDEQRGDKKLPVLLGVSIEWGHRFMDEQVDVARLCEELRLLGEESKFEIMQLLNKEESYGQEIARRLGLDAATVSRHLTTLLRYGCIEVSRKEKRNIYYRVNKNELRNLLETMKRIFFE